MGLKIGPIYKDNMNHIISQWIQYIFFPMNFHDKYKFNTVNEQRNPIKSAYFDKMEQNT